MKPTKIATEIVNGELWGRRARDLVIYQEATIAPVFDAVFQSTGVRGATRYLDIGCGAGSAAAKASALGASTAGLDAFIALIEIAASRVPATTFHVGDLQALPLEDGSFDLVSSFNAIQYAGDVTHALSEVTRVLAPGGAVAIATWGDPEGMEAATVVGAPKPLLPPPPTGTPGPFALSDNAVLRDFVEAGGLDAYQVSGVASPWSYPHEAAALAGLASSGVAARAIEVAGADKVDRVHQWALAPFRRPDGRIEIGATFKMLLAKRSQSRT